MTQELGRYLFPLTPTFAHALRLQRLEDAMEALTDAILEAADDREPAPPRPPVSDDL